MTEVSLPPAVRALASAVLLTGGEDVLSLLPDELAVPARAEVGRLALLDRARRVLALGRSVPAALRPRPAPSPETVAAVASGVPALGPTLRTLGLDVPVAAPLSRARGPWRDAVVAVAAALGPPEAPVPPWVPAPSELAGAGVRLLARVAAGIEAAATQEICRRLTPEEAEELLGALRAGPVLDADVARRIFAAASRDADPSALSVRVGAYRVGWALGQANDAPAGWPADLVGAVRRARAVALLSAPPEDPDTERQALLREGRS